MNNNLANPLTNGSTPGVTSNYPVSMNVGQQLPNSITVTDATYGGNVGAPDGNMTQLLNAACAGKATCN